MAVSKLSIISSTSPMLLDDTKDDERRCSNSFVMPTPVTADTASITGRISSCSSSSSSSSSLLLILLRRPLSIFFISIRSCTSISIRSSRSSYSDNASWNLPELTNKRAFSNCNTILLFRRVGVVVVVAAAVFLYEWYS